MGGLQKAAGSALAPMHEYLPAQSTHMVLALTQAARHRPSSLPGVSLPVPTQPVAMSRVAKQMIQPVSALFDMLKRVSAPANRLAERATALLAPSQALASLEPTAVPRCVSLY